MARVTKSGPTKVRTSIDIDPRILAVFEAKSINKSGWFDRQAKLYFGLTNLDDEIRKLRDMDAAIAIARQEDDRRELDRQRQELTAVMTAQADDLKAVAEKDRSDAHRRKLRDSWLVLEKKKKIFRGSSLLNRLPENDFEGIHEGYWVDLAREVSATAGEHYTEQEVIAYARSQVATC